MRSTFGRRFSISAILSFTFEPPMIATKGRWGFSTARPRYAISFSMRNPATPGRTCATPSVLACARCAVPKASFTYRSNGAARAFAKVGSFASSSGWKRTFSRSSTSPGFASATAFATSGPTQSGSSGTALPRSSVSRAATGASENSGVGPLGRPRWLASATTAPPSTSRRIVGSASVIRRSSVIRPSSRGTLKSQRTRTRRPLGSMSRTVFLSRATEGLYPPWPSPGR